MVGELEAKNEEEVAFVTDNQRRAYAAGHAVATVATEGVIYS